MSKPNQLIDAVKTATAIHEGNYSSLRDKSFVIRDNIEKKKDHHPGDKPVKTSRLDRIEKSITKLAKQMNNRFDDLETRIDRIDARLDYIVQANNLKDSPRNK